VEAAGIERVAMSLPCGLSSGSEAATTQNRARATMHDPVPRGRVQADTVTTVTAAVARAAPPRVVRACARAGTKSMHSTLTRTLPAVVVTLAVGHSTAALACEERRPPDHLSTWDVDAHSDIVVAAVEEIEPNGRGNQVEEMLGRPRPFKARIRIERSLKGQTSPGDVVTIETTKGEEAHAICPLNLEPGLTYLLFLKRDGNQLRVSRYLSMTTSMKGRRAATYVRDVESRVASAPPSKPSPKVEEPKNPDGGAE